jgi:integrase
MMSANRVLLNKPIAAATQKKYFRALRVFLNWCLETGANFYDANSMQEVLLDWIHEVYFGNTPGSAGSCIDAYSALVHLFPTIRGHLPLAVTALNNFKRSRPSVSWPPMSWDLAVSVAVTVCLAAGIRPAVAILVAWQGLFRVSEVVNIRKRDVLDPRAGHLHAGTGHYDMVVAIPKAKTGVNQSTKIEDPQVADLVRLLVHLEEKPDGKLFPFSSSTLRRLFKQASSCKQLGLSDAFVLHSLRHGKATHMFNCGVPLETIMIRGRWVASETARRYIQQSVAIQITLSSPKEVLSYGALVKFRLLEVLEWACSWNATSQVTLKQMQRK